MDQETFENALRWTRQLGGPELSLTGMGEAVLHPEFPEMIRTARAYLPETWILLATNGIALKDEALKAIKEVDATVYVSAHRPEVAGPAVDRCLKLGIKVQVNHQFVSSGFDWAGQVTWANLAPEHDCQYLAQGWATVLQNGDIVNCCMDAHGLYPIGNVNDTNKPTEMNPIPLCAKCHLRVPT